MPERGGPVEQNLLFSLQNEYLTSQNLRRIQGEEFHNLFRHLASCPFRLTKHNSLMICGIGRVEGQVIASKRKSGDRYFNHDDIGNFQEYIHSETFFVGTW